MALLVFALFALVASQAAPPVTVELYSESYCPGCQSYTTNQINDAMNSCVNTIMEFRSYPYGNAQESQNADGTWSYTCQHGVSECDGNMYQACAIEHNGNNALATGVPTWWAYYDCLEKSGNAGVASVAQNCATSSGLDWPTIQTCSGSNVAMGSSTDGNPYMHTIAVTTNNLQPPHQFTPWVVVNGKPLSSSELNLSLISLVCQAYTGTKPSCCSTAVEQMPFNITVMPRRWSINY